MERRPTSTSTEHAVTQGNLLNRMTNRIRQSLELQEILSCAVQEMRSFLDTDRVKIYRFAADGTGQVIAESIAQNRLPSLLGLHFPAGDVPPHAREMFIHARTRVIVDVAAQLTTLNHLDCADTSSDRQQAADANIIQRPVDPCHVEYLTAMGVQSSLVVPILYNQNLWGLLASHHSQAKIFSQEDLEIVQTVADQVSIAIAQSHLLAQAREKADREALINQISTFLHSPLAIQKILQIVIEQIVEAVDASGGRLYLTSTCDWEDELYIDGNQPSLSVGRPEARLENYPFWQQLLNPENPFVEMVNFAYLRSDIDNKSVSYLGAIADLYQEPQLIEIAPFFRSTSIRSILIVPLQYSGKSLGCLTLFRDEIDTDILWAGRLDPDERNSMVRTSFEAWRELKHGQTRKWIGGEIELVRSIATHVTMAVMQYRLTACERQQRVLVEMRNKELNNARNTAEEASRLKSDFLSTTSHELRTPLASTLNYLKLLKEGFYDNEEELNEFIGVAYQSAENLVAIINDVLDIAKIEAGRMSVNWELINLERLLEEQRCLFRLESDRKHIHLIMECEVDSVWADKIKLRQILANLLSNAFKFTEQGKVKLRVIQRVVEPVIEFSIADTGIGIELSKEDPLFEPFVQADGSIKRRYGGTGLGLTICKRLVELMGGQIWLESPGIDRGTTVTFTLPAKEVNANW